MKTAFFIARRLIKNADNERISKPVVRVSIIGVVLSVAVMIISLSVVTGFQNEVRNKVIGFGSHLQITEFSDNQSFESSPMPKNQSFYPGITEIDGVEHIQVYAYKPAILQSNKDTISYSFQNNLGQIIDTTRTDRNIKGVVTKGIGADFSWTFFEKYMVDGSILDLDNAEAQYEILISKKIADNLKFKVGDKIKGYFIQNSGPITRNFTVKGIYKTGLEDFDNDLVFIDIRHLQILNNWGVNAGLTIEDTCYNEHLILTANASGGNENYRYDWCDGLGWTDLSRKMFCPTVDTTIKVIITDFSKTMYPEDAEPLSFPDTAWISIKMNPSMTDITSCYCKADNPKKVTYTDSTKTLYFDEKDLAITVQLFNSGGSYDQYVGGFEVLINDWEQLSGLKNKVKAELDPTIEAKPIDEIYPEIFNWLDFLDTNVYIILILVLLVAIINMSSALLVMILEKTNFIGLMKAMGSTNGMVQRVFIILSSHILWRGLLWGNIVAFTLLLTQKYFGIITLNPEVYYVSVAPVNIDLLYILLLNILTVVVCMTIMLIPSLFVSSIKPVKAIKFN